MESIYLEDSENGTGDTKWLPHDAAHGIRLTKTMKRAAHQQKCSQCLKGKSGVSFVCRSRMKKGLRCSRNGDAVCASISLITMSNIGDIWL